MTREQTNVALAAILETLAEVPEGSPSGVLYAALQMNNAEVYDLGSYQMVLNMLERAQLVTVDNHFVTITDKGKELARQVSAHRSGSPPVGFQ